MSKAPLLLPGLALILAGCVTLPPAQPAPSARAPCVPVVYYSTEKEGALADAIAALKPDNPLVGAMADYLWLRKAVKAAC